MNINQPDEINTNLAAEANLQYQDQLENNSQLQASQSLDWYPETEDDWYEPDCARRPC
jgi:hypothetical protein